MANNFKIRFMAGLTAVMCLAGMLCSCGSSADKDKSSKAADTGKSDDNNTQADNVFTENITGTADGYDYELWKDTGDTEMTITEGGTFSCKWWSNINNALFRRGKKFDCTQTYKELGNITIDYGVDYQPDGNSYMCVYGWTRDPLVEYYIVETWGTWRPPGSGNPLGTVTVDGSTYDIYKTTRYEMPSIDGTQTFDQYWSVRKGQPETNGTKLEGTISVSKHFDAWEQLGLKLGNMYEVSLNIEGFQSQGEATVYRNDLTIDGNYSADPAPEVTKIDLGTDDNGKVLLSSDFEDGDCGWKARGSCAVAHTNEEASDSSGSLFVSGRAENWNGAAIALDSKKFKQGGTYAFKTDAMQNSGEDITMKFTMQYTGGDGDHYDQIDQQTASNGEWITMEGNYTIPDGAVNLILYVESPDSLADFYIDNVLATGTGNHSSEKTSDKTDDAEYTFSDPVPITNTADISWIDADKPMVALAFDDGASATKKDDPAYRIIDTVADNGFHATFFYVGNWIKTEEQIQYAKEKGMETANHTMSHQSLSKMTPEEIRAEYDNCREKLKAIIGEEPSAIMRLPYLDAGGDVTKTLSDVALISCSVDTKDWNNANADSIVDTIKKAKENGTLDGAIVLCHETYETTAEAMEEVIPWLKEEGWQVVTISELFAANGKELMGGTVYTKLS